MQARRMITIVWITLVLTVASPVFSAGDVTVGQFVQKLAEARHLAASDARLAADSLSAAGVRVPRGLDFSRRLTEGDVVAITRGAGLVLTTHDPEEPFDQGQVDRFFAALSLELRGPARNREGVDGDGYIGNGEGPPFDPFTKGKGKGKIVVTPTEP